MESRELTVKDKKIEQGDILYFPNGNDCKHLGIIITADCDLDKGKYGKFISYCNIMTIKEYIEYYYLPKKFSPLIDNEKQVIKKNIKNSFEMENVSDEFFEEILLWDNKKKKEYLNDEKLIENLEYYEKVKQLEKVSYEDYLGIQKRLNLKTKETKEFINNLKDHILNNLPGDKFYINDIPNQQNIGFVVNLRNIMDIEPNYISDVLSSSVTACRIGKLQAPFKQKMIQTLANMFLDIGIPAENEQFREECVLEEIKGVFR